MLTARVPWLGYFHGIGNRQDLNEAFRWHLAAARAGNPVGAMNVAMAYAMGKGVARDPAEAAAWSSWKPTKGMTGELTEPTFERTRWSGSAISAEERALFRAAARAGEPVALTLKPLQSDPRVPTFSRVQR